MLTAWWNVFLNNGYSLFIIFLKNAKHGSLIHLEFLISFEKQSVQN